jgi:hypothetical protein
MHNEPTLSDLTAEADGAGCKTCPADRRSDFDSSSEPRRRRDEDFIISFCRKSTLQAHRIAFLLSQFIPLFDRAEIEHFGANGLKMPPILRHCCRSRTLSSRLFLRKVKRRRNARRSTPGMLGAGPVDRFLHPFFFLSVVTGCGHLA